MKQFQRQCLSRVDFIIDHEMPKGPRVEIPASLERVSVLHQATARGRKLIDEAGGDPKLLAKLKSSSPAIELKDDKLIFAEYPRPARASCGPIGISVITPCWFVLRIRVLITLVGAAPLLRPAVQPRPAHSAPAARNLRPARAVQRRRGVPRNRGPN